jgi:hypothetical protein
MNEEISTIIWDYAHDYREIAMAKEDLGKMLTEVVNLVIPLILREELNSNK